MNDECGNRITSSTPSPDAQAIRAILVLVALHDPLLPPVCTPEPCVTVLRLLAIGPQSLESMLETYKQ